MLHRRLLGSWSKSGGTMNLRQNTTSVAAIQSRIHRLFTIQELVLEYSLTLIVLGCFILVSMSSKIVRKFGAPEVGVSRIWTQQWPWIAPDMDTANDLELHRIWTQQMTLNCTGYGHSNDLELPRPDPSLTCGILRILEDCVAFAITSESSGPRTLPALILNSLCNVRENQKVNLRKTKA